MSDLIQKFWFAISAVRKRGIGFLYIYFKESIWFDLRHGTSTSARVTKNKQSIVSSENEKGDGLLYVSSFSSVIRQTLQIAEQNLGRDKFRDAQFFDLGCGKGKALFIYKKFEGAKANFPAIGIEYDQDLVDVADENRKKMGYSDSDMVLISGSATNILDHIRSKTLVVYIYNSFQGQTFIDVISSIKKIPHVLIYIDPVERHILEKENYKIIADNKGKYNADTWLVAVSKA